MSATQEKDPVTRHFGGSDPAQAAHGGRNAEILVNDVLPAFARAEAKHAADAARREQARAVLVKDIKAILTRNAPQVIGFCAACNADHEAVLPVILAVMRGYAPDAPVPQADIAGCAEGHTVTARFVKNDLPKLLDMVGFTGVGADGIRRFSSVKSLHLAASPVLKAGQKAMTVAMTVGGATVTPLLNSPYVGRDSSGNVVRHLRPAETEAGKAATRKVKEAEYIAKAELKAMRLQKAASEAALGNDPYATTGQFGSWGWAAAVVAGVVALAAFAASGGRPADMPTPAQQQQIVEQMGVNQ